MRRSLPAGVFGPRWAGGRSLASWGRSSALPGAFHDRRYSPWDSGYFPRSTVLGPLGYVTASISLGRKMVKGTSTGARIGQALFAGFGQIRAAAALIPGIGFIVWFLASLFGLGALTIAAWRAGHAPTPVDNGHVRTGEPPCHDHHGGTHLTASEYVGVLSLGSTTVLVMVGRFVFAC